jgi:hypothetical protein
LFPLISGNEFLTLGDDIRANGLVHPIVVHEGQIVDGRNRLLACKDVGVEPRYIEWKQIYNGPMTPAHWIWSVNVERRHLTLDQIVAVQVGIHAWEEQEAARQRQIEAGRQQAERGKEGGRGHKKPLHTKRCAGVSPTEVVPKRKRRGGVVAKLAKEAGVSERKARKAIAVQKANPGLLKRVAQGETTLHEAARQVKATAKPSPGGAAKQCAFKLEQALRRVMRHVDAVLETCDEAARTVFLAELLKTLEAMK